MLKMQANEISPVSLIEGGNVVPLRSTTKTSVEPKISHVVTAVVNELGSVEFEFTSDMQSTIARIGLLMKVREEALEEIRRLGQNRLDQEREERRSKNKGLEKVHTRANTITKLFGITLGLTLGLAYLIPYLIPNRYTLVKLERSAEGTIMKVVKEVDKDVEFYKYMVGQRTKSAHLR